MARTHGQSESKITISLPQTRATAATQSVTKHGNVGVETSASRAFRAGPENSSSSNTSSRANSPNRQKPRALSVFPKGDFRNNSSSDLVDMKLEMMCNWLFQQQVERLWSSNVVEEGIVLKKSRGDYTACPEALRTNAEGLLKAVTLMNISVREGDLKTSNTNHCSAL